MPTPPTKVLTGTSHGSAHRSVSAPKTGWAIDESSEAASTMPDAAA
nr:hypothetical protein [Pimelobacter simplex]